GGVPDSIVLGVICVFSLITLVYPLAQAFYRFEIDYNEGWNAYNAQAAMHHALLYYPKYAWTTVNYPVLSFYAVGYASRFVGDYVQAGRLICLISFLISCVLVGLIVKRLTGHSAPSIFAASFCLALFCTEGASYVAIDDPEMLAHTGRFKIDARGS